MRKTFTAFVAVATIAGSLAATPASAQRGVAGPGRYYEPAPYGAGPGPLRQFWQLRMGDTAFLGRPWLAGPPGASLRLIRDYGEIERLVATIDIDRRPSK
jgi:hypothetical protein